MDNLEKMGLISVVLMIVGAIISLPALAIIGGAIGIGVAIRFIAEEL